MRSALKLTAFSLLLTACSPQAEETVESLVEEAPEVQITEEIVDIQSLRESYGELIDCEQSFAVSEGEFETLVCNQGVIRIWDEPLTDSELAPWTVWCEPALAAGGEPTFEVLFGDQYIIENNNPETIGTASGIDTCVDVVNREIAAFEPSFEDSYGLLTNLAQSGLCFEPPEITATSPLRHVCKGFGLGEEQFSLWLETGEIGSLIDEYSAECGEGIAGTYGETWLKTSYDLDAIVSGERIEDLLQIVSPLPFSNLCS